MKENSIYSHISEMVKNHKYSDEAIIDADDLLMAVERSVDLSDISREDLEKRYLKSAMWVTLNREGYYSIVRREGLYVNYEILNSGNVLKTVKDKLIANRLNDIRIDEKVIDELEKIFTQKLEDLKQMCFDPETGEFYQELTKDELINALRSIYKDQRRAEAV